MRLFIKLFAALALGLGSAFSFAPYSFPPACWLAFALMGMLLSGSQVKESWLLGLAFGIGMNLLAVSWVGTLTPVAAFALVTYQGLVQSLAWLLVKLTQRRAWVAATCFFLVESVNARAPIGGFGWLRLGYTALDTPFDLLYPVFGVSLTGWLLLWLLFLPAAFWKRFSALELALASAVTALSLFLGLALPLPSETGKIKVAIVQGGAPGGGITGIGAPGETTQRSLAETDKLIADIKSGKMPQPDLVVWPENATDEDPTANPQLTQTIQRQIKELKAPVIVGGLTSNPKYTRSWFWEGDTPKQSYDKIHIVPFGEYVPGAEFLNPIFPVLKNVGEQGLAGKEAGVFKFHSATGTIKLGVALCFDVAYPQTIAQSILPESNLLVVQSSNAMFYGTNQLAQQFAITRARAKEIHRDVIVATTNGQSGSIDALGKVTHTLPLRDGAHTVVEVAIYRGNTWAVMLGSFLEPAMILLILSGAVLDSYWLPRRRKGKASRGKN